MVFEGYWFYTIHKYIGLNMSISIRGKVYFRGKARNYI